MQVTQSNSRARGRLPDQLRALLCELSLLERADGSARWSQDGTTVLAAVYGPRQAQQRKEDAERAVVEVVFKPRSGLQGPAEREYEAIVREALEGVLLLGQFPRTSIMVVLQVLADDGSVLPTALNAACAALVDAGVPMRSMFSAVSCGVVQGDQVLIDPDASELEKCGQVLVFSFCHKYDSSKATSTLATPQVAVDDGVLLCHTTEQQQQQPQPGISQDQFLDLVDVCRARCQQIAGFMGTCVVKALA